MENRKKTNLPSVPLIGPRPWMLNNSKRIFNEYLPVNVNFGNCTVKLNVKLGISALQNESWKTTKVKCECKF